jgi:polyhydroxyalkanoate depolymerase
MMYFAYDAFSRLSEPARTGAELTARLMTGLGAKSGLLRHAAAALDVFAGAKVTHERPAFGIHRVAVDGLEVAVVEQVVTRTPFGTLLRFRKEIDTQQPRLLLVAPMSGHFATLLRGTVRTLLPDHDVFITDWHNGRDIPTAAGSFGLDHYIDHVISFLEAIGPGAHVMAVCQPCVQVLAAVALMAESDHAAQPRSMTLMAGPIDTRVSPTKVNHLASKRPIDWFEQNLIASVPSRFGGARRRVYPGFVQLAAFMSMNLDRHVSAHARMVEHAAAGETDKAEAIRSFYEEYFAVLDIPAEFYLETVQRIFQEARLARGELTWGDRRVNPGAIRRTALLTVEGERDDICAVGQTVAAQDLCTGLSPYLKRHHMQPGVGHYGVFNGRRFERQIYPIVRNMILARS